MQLQERCVRDDEMSEDFIKMVNTEGYGVYCLTSIGYIEVEFPEYRNSVTYITKKRDI